MGICGAKNYQSAISFLSDSCEYISLNEDTPVCFLCRVSKIKVRGLETTNLQMKVGSTVLEFGYSSSNFWDMTNEFIYARSVDNLNKDVLEVIVRNGRSLNLATISMAGISIGPSHLSFPLSSSGRYKGRVSFTLEMLHISNIELATENVSCEFIESTPGPYTFSVKVKTDTVFESSRDLRINFEGNFNHLRDASLQLLVWSNKVLLGECWVSLIKLWKNPLISSPNKFEKVLISVEHELDKTYTSDLEEKLWKFGKHVGEVRATIKVNRLPMVQQLLTGVNTELGYKPQSSNISDSHRTWGHQMPSEIKSIANLTKKLSQKLSSKKHMNSVQKLLETCKKLEKLLLISYKDTMTSFIYNTNQDLLEAQMILINLGEHLVKYSKIIFFEVKALYFRCLMLVCKRGELDIGSLSIAKDHDVSVVKQYLSFFSNALELALSRLKFKGLDTHIMKYVECILAQSWFRIPSFRQNLIKILKEKSFEEVLEWRGVYFSLEEAEDDKTGEMSVFDWKSHIYKDLEFEFKVSYAGLESRIGKRGVAFFRFLGQLVLYIHESIVVQRINWSDVPGYKTLLKVFLLEMKERDISRYPEALDEASCILLHNSSLLNPFVRICFAKANVFQPVTVRNCLELLNKWLQTLYKNGLTALPPSLDVKFFVKGMIIALRDEFCITIAKALHVVYCNYQLFSDEIKQEIVMQEVITKNFQRFFFHWSFQVRRTFFHLLQYRILGVHDLSLEKEENLEYSLKIAQFARKSLKLINKMEGHTDPQEDIINEYNDFRAEYKVWASNIKKREDKNWDLYPVFNIRGDFIDMFEDKDEETW